MDVSKTSEWHGGTEGAGPGAAWQSSGLTQQRCPGKRKFPTLSLVFTGYVVHGTQTVSVQNVQAANPGTKPSHL